MDIPQHVSGYYYRCYYLLIKKRAEEGANKRRVEERAEEGVEEGIEEGAKKGAAEGAEGTSRRAGTTGACGSGATRSARVGKRVVL